MSGAGSTMSADDPLRRGQPWAIPPMGITEVLLARMASGGAFWTNSAKIARLSSRRSGAASVT